MTVLQKIGNRLLHVHHSLYLVIGRDQAKSLRFDTVLSRNYLSHLYAGKACHNSSRCGRVMRGQKLFIRPIEAADHEAVGRFLQTQTASVSVPACGLLGKLVGELVAIVGMQITADAIEIDDIVVEKEFRRKRIGRVMLDEVEQIAAKMERNRLVVGEAAGAHEFFRRVGFEREGARWIRQVRSHGAERASR